MEKEETVYVIRMAYTNTRVTKGSVYVLIDGKIIDDGGNTMTPALGFEDHWEYYIPPTSATPTPHEINPEIEENTKDSSMKRDKSFKVLETKVFVNGIEGKDVSDYDIISLISNIEVEINYLSNIDTMSTNILDNIKSLQKENSILATFLDNR